jgi:hypothetical protein
MKYRNFFGFLTPVLLMMQFASSAMAVDGKGNGGVSVVCRDAAGKITSAEILDLFEGRNQFGLNYPTGGTDVDTLVELAQLKMVGKADFLIQFRSVLSDVRAGLVFLPRGVGLTPTDDAFPTITRKGCHFEQLANYRDEDSKIYVDQEIYNKLSQVDRAALIIHEVIYKLARVNQNEVSSVRSRKLTSQVLALNSNQGVIDSLMASIGKKPEPAQPVVVNRLVSGLYATDSIYCGLQLYVQGDTLTTVSTSNPKMDLRCRDGGKVHKFEWEWANLNGRQVQGYVMRCEHDRSAWCLLIEVINERAIVQTSSDGSRALYFLW